MKNVQIPQELFMKLLRYHLLDDDSCTEEVKNGLEQKMNAMVERELYTRSKTAPTEEEREKARQEYLDRRGIPERPYRPGAHAGEAGLPGPHPHHPCDG